MPEIFTDNILRGWRLLNSSMGKWGLSFPLPFHHVDSFACFSAATRIIVYTLLHGNLLTDFSIESIISFPKPMRKVSFHFLFLLLLHSLLSDWGGTKGKAEVSESNLLTFSPTWLSSLPVCHLLLQSSADHLFSLPAPKKKKIPFFISPYKAKPEHQGEPCVQPALCRLSAVTRHHLEIITHPKTRHRLNMCKGTRRVQTCYLNCHKFFLEERFILTLLDKIKRPRMSPLYSHPRQTTENN